nr:unnamed protein product [Digitaria exilis]
MDSSAPASSSNLSAGTTKWAFPRMEQSEQLHTHAATLAGASTRHRTRRQWQPPLWTTTSSSGTVVLLILSAKVADGMMPPDAMPRAGLRVSGGDEPATGWKTTTEAGGWD